MATATLIARYTVQQTLDGVSPANLNTTHANAAANENDLQILGTGCASTGYSGNPPGSITPQESEMSASAATTTLGDWDGSNKHLGIWLRTLYPVFSKADGGLCILVQCSGTNQRFWFNIAGEPEYKGEWLFAVLNTHETVSGTPDAMTPFITVGSPSMTGANAITGVGGGFAIRISKGEDFLQNQYFDNIIISDGSDDFGNQYTGGTSGDRLLFSDLVDADASGILQGSGLIFNIYGELYLGGAAATTYLQDTNKIVQFADMPVATDLYKIIGVTGTLTDIDLQGFNWLGLAAAPFTFDFSGLAGSDAANFDSDTFSDAALIKLGPRASADSANFQRCAEVEPFGRTMNDPVFLDSALVTLTNASDVIDGGHTTLHDTLTNVGFVSTDDFDKVLNHAFDNTGGVGHAIDLGTIAATRTDACDGNTFTGYSTTVNGNKAVRVNVASGQTYTINVTGGGNLAANMVYNSGPGTVVVQNAVTIQVTVLDDVTGSGILDARVQLYLTSDYSTSVLNGATNASGIVSDTYAYGGDVAIEGWARQFDIAGTDYIQKNISGSITAAGFFLTVRLERY